MQRVDTLRNVAIIAHVDHGKTTLVDAHAPAVGRASAPTAQSPSGSWTRWTSSVRRASPSWPRTPRSSWSGVKINIVDTPGHADFGGEVERALTMVDGVLLLVDAAEGPLPQTRFVLRKALERDLPVIVVINKIDRPDARIDEVLDEVVRTVPRPGRRGPPARLPGRLRLRPQRLGVATAGRSPTTTSTPLFETILSTIPPPEHDPESALQVLVTNLDASLYVGRLALCRVLQRPGQARASRSAWCRADGTIQPAKITVLYITRGHERIETDEAGPAKSSRSPGSTTSPSARPSPTIDDPRPLPADHRRRAGDLDDHRHQHLAPRRPRRQEAHRPQSREPARQGTRRQRVDPGEATERPDTLEVQGRGELQLGVLVETMRREGFELTVGKPQVLTGRSTARVHEPFERVIRRRSRGLCRRRHPAARRPRKGRMSTWTNHGTGWVRHGFRRAGPRADRLPHRVPDRDPRHRHHAPRLRRVGAVGGRDPQPAHRVDRGGPHAASTTGYAIEQPPGARRRCSSRPATDVYEG